MRFKILFDRGLVSEQYIKSWFVVEEAEICTGEIIDQIKSMFNIKQGMHLELEDFVIPDTQTFTNIVREDEMICAKLGKICIGKVFQNGGTKAGFGLRSRNEPKHKKIVKNEESSESISSRSVRTKKVAKYSSSSSEIVKKNQKAYISESSDSTPQKPPSVAKPKIPIKSVFKKQPEPEFIPKPIYSYNLSDFSKCTADDLKLNDEVLYKTLEILDDLTPGLSDFKLGKVTSLNDSTLTITHIRETLQQELAELNEMEIVDELFLENFQVTLEKQWLKDLMKRNANTL